MKPAILHATHNTSNDPGSAVATGPGAYFPPGRSEKTRIRLGKIETYRWTTRTPTTVTNPAIDISDEEQKARVDELRKINEMRYEDLPGTPKRMPANLTENTATRHRNFDCDHYDICLTYAGVKCWPSMSCRECPHA